MVICPKPVSRWVRRTLVGVTCSVLPWLGFGQQSMLGYEYYSLDDGLSDREVTAILQDDRHFTWVGTPNGLNRWDGYEFITFNNHPDNHFRISGTNVESLAKDADGKLVILYRSNKLFFDLLDPDSYTCRQVRLYPEDGIKGFVRQIHVTREGKILILSIHDDGTHLYQYTGAAEGLPFRLLFRMPEIHSSVSPSIDLVQLPDSTFLINDSELGLRLFSPEGALIKAFRTGDFDCMDRLEKYPGLSTILHRDRQGNLWLSLAQMPGIFRYNPEFQFFEQITSLPSANFTHLWEDKMGNLLLADTEIMSTYYEVRHLYCLSSGGQLQDFSYLLDISPRILSLYAEDFFKTVFLGTNFGLGTYQNSRSKIRTYLARQLQDFQVGTVLRGITGDGRGTVFFATERGPIYQLDTHIDYLDTLQITDIDGLPLPISGAQSLFFDRSGKLWGIANFPRRPATLFSYDPGECIASIYPYQHPISSFTLAQNGEKAWLVSQGENEKGSLLEFDPASGSFSEITFAATSNPLKNSTPFTIIRSSDHRLWVGTDNGLFCIDPSQQTVRNFRIETDDTSPGLSSNSVFIIHEDPEGKLWLGTSNGLNILDPSSGQVRVLDKRNMLANNTVYGILPDEKNNYWVSTSNGLSYLETSKSQFRSFFQSDGLSHNEFQPYSYYRDENGRYYFGGINGVNAFYPQELLVSEAPPALVLTRLSRYNSRQDTLITQLTELKEVREIDISPYDNFFQVHFMLPNFSSPRKNQFEAKLEGLDKDWTYLGNTPYVRYNKLPAGRYTLRIRGADPNGNWTTQSLNFRVRIRPFFVNTWWFRLLGLGIISLLVYAVFQYNLERKLSMERLRTKISSDIHDEVSGLLSGIAMQSDLLYELTTDQNSKDRLKLIGEKSRKAMSKMRDVIWSIDSRNDKLDDLLLRMHEHADEMLSPLGVQYHFEVNHVDRNAKIPVKVRQELYFIFKEAINNIAKHANATQVEIHIANKNGQFEMIVSDNGQGKLSKINGKTGQGLANIRMRAQRIDALLDIRNGQGFTVHLSMKKFV